MERWNVGVLLFDGVALLDVAGPFDVLTRARLEPGVDDAEAGRDLAEAVVDPPAHAGYRAIDAPEARRLLGGR